MLDKTGLFVAKAALAGGVLAAVLATIGLTGTSAAAYQGKGGGGGGTTPPPNPEIAFADAGIKVMNADGTNVRTVSALKKGEWARGPVWSPNGQYLAYSGFHSSLVGIYTVRLDGTQRTRIVALPPDAFMTHPDWARNPGPTGQKMIAFVTDAVGDGVDDLYVVNPDGTGLSEITQSSADEFVMDCAWAEDGSRIFFAKLVPFGSGIQFELREIYLGLDGTGKTVKTGESVLYQSTNMEFAFMRTANTFDGLVFVNLLSTTAYGVHLLNLDTVEPTPVRIAAGQCRWPSFSPTDSMVAFHQSGTGGGIFTMNVDGSNKVRINSRGLDPNWKRQAN